MVIHASEQQKECCRDDTRPLTHDFVSTTSTQNSSKLANKTLDNASFKSWRGPDMYVTQYIYFQMKISFKFVE